uniref:Cardiomyopathy associated 5 n=1 Tax=Oryzias latipes TaxID=8090 RepID=A0A3B3IPH8_ORYLA
MEECESVAFEMTELQESRYEASDVISQDDEDEVEELQNSLREVVQDQSVKPKLQCLMVDPSFSMVTVQSEDSGIVWETASSRCSTPWASEASSTSESYSMEGSGAAGKITIEFDEDKVIRRRTRSGGRSSRLGDRLSRLGSSRSASALGVERPEMAEVSLPNVKEENTGTETDLEEIKNKDQQLFSLISEGYEILNIRVPSKLPTVDEEESTELQDNLFYLDQTPKIKARNHQNWAEHKTDDQQEEDEGPETTESSKGDSSQPSLGKGLGHTPAQTDSACDIDYFEKFTLLDVVSGEQASVQQDNAAKPAATPPTDKRKAAEEAATESPSASEDSFVFVTDVEIVGEHLDEVFYGEGPPALQQRGEDEDSGARMRTGRESQRSTKESGSVLFMTEETTLTPIFISPGPPKIIDPILLEEPSALSFMYSDLYEDAEGERRRSDEECSEAESVVSEKSYRRRLSDSEEAEGYLEKFILKDETPVVDEQVELVKDTNKGRMVWPQSEFEMTGSLTRVEEKEEEEKTKTEEGKMQEESVGEDLHSEKIVEEPLVAAQAVEAAEDLEVKSEKKQILDQQDHFHKEKAEATESPSPSTETIPVLEAELTQEGKEIQEDDKKGTDKSRIGTAEPHETQEVVKKMSTSTASGQNELPALDTMTKIQAENTENSLYFQSVSSEETLAAEAVDHVKEPEKEASSKPEPETECPEGEASPTQIKVIIDCDCEVQTEVKVSEKEDDETAKQVRIDDQEVTKVEEPKSQTETSEEVLLPVETGDEGQEYALQTQIPAEMTEPLIPAETETEPAIKHQTDQSITHKESDKTSEISSKFTSQDSGDDVQDIVSVGDEFILLVPKGQTVEMDIEVGQWSEKTPKATVVPLEPDRTGKLQPPEPLTDEAEPELKEKEDQLDLEQEQPQAVLIEEPATDDHEMEMGIEEDKVAFTPGDNLSGLDEEVLKSKQTEEEQKADVQMLADAMETDIPTEDALLIVDLKNEDVEQKQQQDQVVLEAAGVAVAVEELGYEIISEQEAKSGTEVGKTFPEQEEKMDIEKDEQTELFSEELNEEDYEIIDGEEESQARLAAELQGMDWFCATCECLLSEDDSTSAEHLSHDLNSVDNAYEKIKETLGNWISELQERSEIIEDLVSELELAYNSVEDQFVENEEAMQAQNEEMKALEKIDSAKSTLEITAREAETDARPPEDIHARLKAALDATLSLELGPKGLLVFEDYAKANTSSSNSLAQRKGIPVPKRPTLQPQEPGSATSTSVTVYWTINTGDVIDCFQVYCMEHPQGVVSEEYRVTVKESYCVLEELEPDKMYKVWVMAVNYTGCSLPSDRLIFRTAPSVPVMDTERCTVLWDSATLRWSPAKQTPGQTYTLEYCRQYELEGEGLRSISGVSVCEQRVVLQPNENYLFYIKAVNEAGASEQSEAALISTKGTRFHLLKDSAHAALELSEDQTTLNYFPDARKAVAFSDTECPSILGEMFPARGLYYWETVVSGSAAYRLGVAYSTASSNGSLGENSSSWCLQCVPSSSGCRFMLLHNSIQSSVFVTDILQRVGTLLDYQHGCLSFYNAESGRLLGTLKQRFTEPCCPALALEQPGSMQLCMVQELPQFAKDS